MRPDSQPTKTVALALALALLAPAARPQTGPPGTGGSSSFSVLSPYPNLARSRQVLDTAALRLALELDYAEEPAAAAEPKAADLPGVQSLRVLSKPAAGGWVRRLELALAEYPAGGYRLYVYGTETGGEAPRPNPDLAAAESTLGALVGELTAAKAQAGAAKFGDPGNRFVSYRLSYVQADRAVALLKVLGYSVIEFQAAAGGQPTVYDQIFSVAQAPGAPPGAELRLPVVIRLIDSEKTSLLQPAAPVPGRPAPVPMAGGGRGGQAVDLGGLFLDQVTTGVPQQRLLIVYDGNDPEPMQVLVNLLRDEVDVPAQQILIEALVIELNRDRLSELGVELEGSKDGSTFSWGGTQGPLSLPFTYTFERPSPKTLLELNVTLKALVTRGDAEVLSRPSVLVLDGRQARIQVGEKIPFTSNISATNTGTLSSTDYLTTGIVLNLRPRASTDGSSITMQVETLISSPGPSGFLAETGVLIAPPIQSREVQTLVRVANNTPFIIGGLIDTTQQTDVTGVPGLSRIPGIGALFRRKTKINDRREVIVVITPHIVPLEDSTFSYVIPKDSDVFNSFGKDLFRNVYRLQSRDIFDLSFVYESQVLQDLVARVRERSEVEPGLKIEEPFASILSRGVPGEEILIRRMLWEVVVRRIGFDELIDPEKIFFFPDTGDGEGLAVTPLAPLLRERSAGRNALALSFAPPAATTMERPFAPPRGVTAYEQVTAEGLLDRMRAGNARDENGDYTENTVILTDEFSDIIEPMQLLRGVLALKRLLELNKDLPLTIDGFHVGIEIIFPNEADMRARFHLVDREAVKLCYEVLDYYLAFEKEFTVRHREILERLGGGQPAGS